jgi:hypothetical protein
MALSGEIGSSSVADPRMDPDADHVHQREADPFVGRRLKDLSVFV